MYFSSIRAIWYGCFFVRVCILLLMIFFARLESSPEFWFLPFVWSLANCELCYAAQKLEVLQFSGYFYASSSTVTAGLLSTDLSYISFFSSWNFLLLLLLFFASCELYHEAFRLLVRILHFVVLTFFEKDWIEDIARIIIVYWQTLTKLRFSRNALTHAEKEAFEVSFSTPFDTCGQGFLIVLHC